MFSLIKNKIEHTHQELRKLHITNLLSQMRSKIQTRYLVNQVISLITTEAELLKIDKLINVLMMLPSSAIDTEQCNYINNAYSNCKNPEIAVRLLKLKCFFNIEPWFQQTLNRLEQLSILKQQITYGLTQQNLFYFQLILKRIVYCCGFNNSNRIIKEIIINLHGRERNTLLLLLNQHLTDLNNYKRLICIEILEQIAIKTHQQLSLVLQDINLEVLYTVVLLQQNQKAIGVRLVSYFLQYYPEAVLSRVDLVLKITTKFMCHPECQLRELNLENLNSLIKCQYNNQQKRQIINLLCNCYQNQYKYSIKIQILQILLSYLELSSISTKLQIHQMPSIIAILVDGLNIKNSQLLANILQSLIHVLQINSKILVILKANCIEQALEELDDYQIQSVHILCDSLRWQIEQIKN